MAEQNGQRGQTGNQGQPGPTSEPKSEAKAELKKIRAMVARGRTVVVPNPDPNATELVGFDKEEKKPIHRRTTIEYPEHSEVELDAHEVATLRKSGYLVDPNVPAHEHAPGGVTVTDSQKLQGAHLR